jgi:hypothetical protein
MMSACRPQRLLQLIARFQEAYHPHILNSVFCDRRLLYIVYKEFKRKKRMQGIFNPQVGTLPFSHKTWKRLFMKYSTESQFFNWKPRPYTELYRGRIPPDH